MLGIARFINLKACYYGNYYGNSSLLFSLQNYISYKLNYFFQAISGHFASTDSYYIHVEGTTQQMLEDEIKQIVAKRIGKGIEITLSDVWKMKKLLVRGQDCNL